jgi:hypothetical protein
MHTDPKQYTQDITANLYGFPRGTLTITNGSQASSSGTL